LACPYFDPVQKSSRRIPFRLPLNAFWLGRCAAPGEDTPDMSLSNGSAPDMSATGGSAPDMSVRMSRQDPAEEFQLEYCNRGYAGNHCPRFPAAAEADAVRFAAGPAGTLFILEKEHRPVRFGQVSGIEPGSLLDRQRIAWKTP
jgi:hypothetical protein